MFVLWLIIRVRWRRILSNVTIRNQPQTGFQKWWGYVREIHFYPQKHLLTDWPPLWTLGTAPGYERKTRRHVRHRNSSCVASSHLVNTSHRDNQACSWSGFKMKIGQQPTHRRDSDAKFRYGKIASISGNFCEILSVLFALQSSVWGMLLQPAQSQ